MGKLLCLFGLHKWVEWGQRTSYDYSRRMQRLERKRIVTTSTCDRCGKRREVTETLDIQR
jgi:hypothetical protein